MSSRLWLISDEQWDVLRGLLPPQRPATGRPGRDHRQVLEGIIYRYRTGVAWRDLPERFGPWKTVWKRHRAWAADGTLDGVHQALIARADAFGVLGVFRTVVVVWGRLLVYSPGVRVRPRLACGIPVLSAAWCDCMSARSLRQWHPWPSCAWGRPSDTPSHSSTWH